MRLRRVEGRRPSSPASERDGIRESWNSAAANCEAGLVVEIDALGIAVEGNVESRGGEDVAEVGDLDVSGIVTKGRSVGAIVVRQASFGRVGDVAVAVWTIR